MDEDVLMICDGEKEIGIAGIMGGENSMITDDVKTMLFEAACFDGVNIRKSSKRIGLRTDASAKFEKGLDPNNAQAAIDRACQLVEEMGAGEVVGGMVGRRKSLSGCRSTRIRSMSCWARISLRRKCSDTLRCLTWSMTQRQRK